MPTIPRPLSADFPEREVKEAWNLFRQTCVDSVTDFPPTAETALHLATMLGDLVLVKMLIDESIDEPCHFNDAISSCRQEMILQLAASRKQTIAIPSHSHTVDLDSENDWGSEKPDNFGKQWQKPSSHSPLTRSEFSVIGYQGVLFMATLLATMTFHAVLRPPTCLSVVSIPTLSDQSSNAKQVENQEALLNHLFFLVNSMAFFASLAVIVIILHELPIKPWLLIIVSSATGAYMCAVVINSPEDVVTVLLLGSSIFIAAFFKCLALHRMVIHHLQWLCNRIHLL